MKRMQGAYAEAEQLYSKAFEIYASIDDKYSQRATLLSLAEVYRALGDQEKARSLADQAERITRIIPADGSKGRTRYAGTFVMREGSPSAEHLTIA